jgi:tetratricopeptide (TPR) repeat protein
MAGRAALDAGDAPLAITDFREALRLDPALTDAQGPLASALARASRFDELAAFVDSALARRPDDSAMLYYRGVARRSAGDLEAALASFQRAAALDPSSIEPKVAIGECLLVLKQPAAALGVLREADTLARGSDAHVRALVRVAELQASPDAAENEKTR